jgi:hypothetical protein
VEVAMEKCGKKPRQSKYNLLSYLKESNVNVNKVSIATILSVSGSAITKKIDRGGFDMEDVVTVCNYLNISPTKALLHFGILNQSDIDINSSENKSSNLIEQNGLTLMLELLRRVDLLKTGLEDITNNKPKQ